MLLPLAQLACRVPAGCSTGGSRPERLGGRMLSVRLKSQSASLVAEEGWWRGEAAPPCTRGQAEASGAALGKGAARAGGRSGS